MKIMLILASVVVCLIGCGMPEAQEVPERTWSASELAGSWTLSKVECVTHKQDLEKFLAMEQAMDPEYYLPVYADEEGILQAHDPEVYFSAADRDLMIEGDSLYALNYPLELSARHAFQLKDNVLKYNGQAHELKMSEDGQTMTLSYVDEYGLYLEETWKRTTFDPAILSVLKNYRVNFPELAGKWLLIRESWDAYGTEYRLEFDYTIPDEVFISTEELASTLHTDRSYMLLTNGKKRKYFLRYAKGELWLVPDAWYDMQAWHDKGYPGEFYLRFERPAVEE